MFESRKTGRRFTVFGGYRTGYHLAPWFLGRDADVRTRVELQSSIQADRCRQLAEQDGLVVFCGASAPAELQSELLRIPVLMEIERPTPATFEGPKGEWGKSAADNIRRIKRGGFTYEVVPAEPALDEFYERMFVKTMVTRHGRRSYINSRQELRRFAVSAGAEMLRVLQDGRCVAAVLNRRQDQDYRVFVLGWDDAGAATLRSGAVAAIYWFSFQRAAALGCSRILLGGTFPCLSDGVLLHKAHWGARLSFAKPERGTLGLLLDPTHPSVRQMLNAHTFVGVNNRDNCFGIGARAERDSPASRLLSDVRHYIMRDSPGDADADQPDDLPPRLRSWFAPAPR